ncbi:unnamed protein product [Vitrella brassicaformis CCMP3155]|uniref:NADP-dependent oxidoreductase domain-containing protein n=2 Tax=Vitrella brassicaformis TaxID=1169539 RepID=A0A0G4FV16_VITBC|nr:unnamed protein product [Vitrella brassicaformis CCMP3155]|eukprot:CEM18750.1 unnamed protein product [Vitrella brassicaformis CCMP3155]
MPRVGFGTYRLQGHECEVAVEAALECGYRLIDTASIYKNEEHVKAALSRWRSRHGGEHVCITSKASPYEMGFDKTYAACLQSLRRLGVEQLDLYLLHWPGVAKRQHMDAVHRKARHESWKALECLCRDNKVRAIGVSNFNPSHLDALYEDGIGIPPAVNQVEFHPFCLRRDLLAWLPPRDKTSGADAPAFAPLVIQGYASLGSGDSALLTHPAVLRVASECHRTPAQVLLRWSLQHGVPVIPRSAHTDRIRGNLQVYDFRLSEAQMGVLDGLQQSASRRFCWDSTTVL